MQQVTLDDSRRPVAPLRCRCTGVRGADAGCSPTDGYSYEREAIAGWISTKNRSSPMTNLPLMTTLLTPNYTLKMAIDRWRSSQ